MNGNYFDIGIFRPSEFEDNCYHLVFEFTYTDIAGNTCSYFGEIEIFFPKISNDSYSCGSIEYAGQEECQFPDLLSSDFEQIENFQNSFKGIHSSEWDHDQYINPENIFPLGGDEFCIIVPPDGCTEIEMVNCPGGNTDQCISAADLLELRKLILGITTETPNLYGGLLSDINESGGVSTLDLVLIAREILGLQSPYSGVGDCVIFDPSSDGLNGIDLSGLGGWSDFDYSVEICDVEEFDVIVGVIGDVNGDCPCDIVDGITGDDQEDEIILYWDEDFCKFNTPQMSFYDLVLDITGNISSIDVVKERNNEAIIEVIQNEDRYSILINSFEQKPVSLKECMSYINIKCNGPIEFTDKTLLIDENVKVRPLNISSDQILPRSSYKEDSLEESILKVMDNQLYIFQKEEDFMEIYLYATNGTLIYTQIINNKEEIINLSDYLYQYRHGNLFFIVGRKNGETKVEKLIWQQYYFMG